MVKKKAKRKTRKSKRIKRIGVYVSIQANFDAQKVKLDKYIVEQGCQRLTPISVEKNSKKGIAELYTRVHFVGKRKAKKLKPITPDIIEEELQRVAERLKQELKGGYYESK